MTKKFSLSLKQNEGIFIPLGGCGHLGKNFSLYYYQKTWIIVDCGSSFIEDRVMPGVEMIVPDISFIKKNNIQISALVLTHAHEDHIGAVVHFIEDLNCPVYGTKFAINFLKTKLASHHTKGINVKTKILTNAEIKIGSIDILPVDITHSTPEMKGLLIKMGEVKIFHTGDWKFDDIPVIGVKTDFDLLKKIGDEGIDVVMADSTNAMSEGRSGNEGDLEHSLYQIIEKQKGMVLISAFASNVARIETICNVAKKVGRFVAVSGLSLNRMVAIAKESGYLTGCEILDVKEIGQERNKAIIIATGCQGEPRASLSKIAHNEHGFVTIKKGDVVILSSKIIPGNEKKIFNILNKLAEHDIEVITEKDHFVHVSGHPKQDELREMYSILKPKAIIPVHGEVVHLREHCHFVKKCGIENAHFVLDGDVIKLSKDGISKVCKIDSGYLGIDGNLLLPEISHVVYERKKIKDAGILIISCNINKKSHLLQELYIDNVGVFDKTDHKILTSKLYDEGERIINNFIKAASVVKKSQDEKNVSLQDVLQSRLKKVIEKYTGKITFVKAIIHYY